MGCPEMYPWKNRNQRISEVGKDLSDHGVQGMAEHSTVWEQIPAHPCMTLLIPRREELMAALTFPSHPNTFGPREPPGIFSRYPPNILQQEILQQKKSSCNISRVFPLRPEQKCCRNNLAQGKMSVCLVVSAQGSWSGAVGSHSSLATESF